MSGLDKRSAIEALRAGVPNRASIKLLGITDAGLSEQFQRRMDESRAELRVDRAPKGLVIAGDFGSGKSHALGYLRELALAENFVVSLVPVSKEMPLFDAGKLYAAAIRHAMVPERNGAIRNEDVMTAVMSRLRPGTDAYDDLEHWASSARSGLSPLFAALLHLIPKKNIDPADLDAIARFFAGGRLAVTTVRQWLRAAGAARLFDLKPIKAPELAVQRLHFAPRAMAAAGFSGWCVLLDEVELVGRYSVRQRARSYAELCRWCGLSNDVAVPGLLSVGAVTGDFFAAVINDRRDEELAPQKLEEAGQPQLAKLARRGMKLLANPHQLPAPDERGLADSLDRIGQLYGAAYDWTPPALDVGERLVGKPMRRYIKSWITKWDIARLYGEQVDTVDETMTTDTTENPDLERSAPEDDAE